MREPVRGLDWLVVSLPDAEKKCHCVRARDARSETRGDFTSGGAGVAHCFPVARLALTRLTRGARALRSGMCLVAWAPRHRDALSGLRDADPSPGAASFGLDSPFIA